MENNNADNTFVLSEAQLQQKLLDIRLLLLDVDGVLTDGRLYFSADGSEMKSFSTLDGQGIKALRRSGVEVGIITGRKNPLVEKRASDLGIKLLMQGREDKYRAMQELLQQHQSTLPGIELKHIAFAGDDYPDLSVMVRVGLSFSVGNAHPEVVKRCHWQSSRRGGEGAVREICDLIMQAQGSYGKILQEYLA